MSPFLAAFALGAAILFAACYFLATISFAASLKRQHPEVWKAHVSPRWLNFRSSPISAVRFIKSPAYRQVSSDRARTRGRRLLFLHRALNVLLFALFVYIVVMVLRTVRAS